MGVEYKYEVLYSNEYRDLVNKLNECGLEGWTYVKHLSSYAILLVREIPSQSYDYVYKHPNTSKFSINHMQGLTWPFNSPRWDLCTDDPPIEGKRPRTDEHGMTNYE